MLRRADLPGRMAGGIFQGSSTADFSSGVIQSVYRYRRNRRLARPPLQTITTTTKFQIRAVTSLLAGSYGNIAEIEFDGAGSITTSNKLTGTVSGTAGSYGNSGNTFTNVFDSNLNTYFDAPIGTGVFISDAFSSEAQLTQIKICPGLHIPVACWVEFSKARMIRIS